MPRKSLLHIVSSDLTVLLVEVWMHTVIDFDVFSLLRTRVRKGY